MKEEEINKLIEKFEKIIGPVAKGIAKEKAKELNILEDDKISPKTEDDYNKFIEKITEEYSKIVGKEELVKRIMEGNE